ncbi:MAG: VOC family protein [Alphaproteobacteria bacterium]|nr:VOC family protein [Alphaproteobacteria bacterium]
MKIEKIHHIAIICSDYEISKKFYTEILGFKIINEHFRVDKNSFKLDLALNEQYIIELFSFPYPPQRPTMPESTGLRHLAFGVKNMNSAVEFLKLNNVLTEPIRIDEFTHKKFTFFNDPDNLPLELYEL